MYFLQEVVYEGFGIWLFLTIFHKETDIFVFSPHVVDHVFRDSINFSFRLPHNVNVLRLGDLRGGGRIGQRLQFFHSADSSFCHSVCFLIDEMCSCHDPVVGLDTPFFFKRPNFRKAAVRWPWTPCDKVAGTRRNKLTKGTRAWARYKDSDETPKRKRWPHQGGRQATCIQLIWEKPFPHVVTRSLREGLLDEISKFTRVDGPTITCANCSRALMSEVQIVVNGHNRMGAIQGTRTTQTKNKNTGTPHQVWPTGHNMQ